MTQRHQTGPVRQRLLAVAIFAALLAQMALPALHALRNEGPALLGAPTWQLASTTPAAARAAEPAPTHDPAACPVCQSLMRTSPLATPPIACGESRAAQTSAPPARLECADFAVVMTGHPPRAPPPPAFHLA